ncbi:Phosphoserine phosphatase, chloroplastic [Apostasia shenzhenica]|uniref:phosphoserine phosphatase n=1 Tax=Apostasia shenzhenica TaxID=1088818 RepID=A0A2I0AXQ0_9ASPA|nr:Phosphoserine phosphatase, chloroplastic [Apostasia shenzhenica]
MRGSVPFEEDLVTRQAMFHPSLTQLYEFHDKKAIRISPGIAGLTNNLKARNTDVYFISGGFRQMI